MKLDSAPDQVVRKLIRMSDHVRALADERDRARAQVNRARDAWRAGDKLNARIAKLQYEIDDATNALAEFDKTVAVRATFANVPGISGAAPPPPEQRAALEEKRKALEAELQQLRNDHDVHALVKLHEEIERRCKAEEGILEGCRSRLDGLPHSAKLESVRPSLAGRRARRGAPHGVAAQAN